MKYFTIFALLLVIFVAYSSAQHCVGGSRNPSCSGARNTGHGGAGCKSRTMWYYDAGSRHCREMHYLGCAGNHNRHCSRASCEQKCRH